MLIIICLQFKVVLHDMQVPLSGKYWLHMREKMPIHTVTRLVLTAVAVLWPVIGLTVIGTVFLPPRALEMGHNAAVNLAAAVRRKPCNCSFPRLPFFFLCSNADMII